MWEQGAMAKKAGAGEKLLGPFETFMQEFPAVFEGYDAMGMAAQAKVVAAATTNA